MCRALYEAKPPFKAFLQSAMLDQVKNIYQEAKKMAAPTVDTFYAGAEYDEHEPTLIISAKRAATSPDAQPARKRARV